MDKNKQNVQPIQSTDSINSSDSDPLKCRGKLHCFNYLDKISTASDYSLIEVEFKNTRKGFYSNPSNLDLHIGDNVVVEGAPGHDIGKVSLVGKLVALQMRKNPQHDDFVPKKIYRKATPADIDRFREAKAREHDTMIRSRKISEELGLNMKIGDVEYQGDGAKAIFYYIADERVDFRKLIRILAETFNIRVEMKQIGARQEAGRIGGIGPCGRPLCCASWLTHFSSVGTGAARFQDISMNPQKLAGQCAKLKCCLNFEVDTYVEAQHKLPNKDIVLETKDETYYLYKVDILKRELTYSTTKGQAINCTTIPAARAFEIIALNKRGVTPDSLSRGIQQQQPQNEYVDLVGQDSLTRFDKSKRKKKQKSAPHPKAQPSQKNGAQKQLSRQQRKSRQQQQPNNDKKPQQPPRRQRRQNNQGQNR